MTALGAQPAGAAQAPHAPREDVRLLVVIVNYRTADLVIECLASLEPQFDPSLDRVVVVDNDSPDGSAVKLESAIASRGWPAWATVHRAGRNGGFAAGNNAGVGAALRAGLRPALIWLLNPDTIAQPGCVEGALAFLRERPDVDILGLGVDGPDGAPQTGAFRFPSPLGEADAGFRFGPLTRLLHRWVVPMPQAPAAHACDWTTGASMIVRSSAWRTIGPMDEGFFLYYEEVDFCRRARRLGLRVWTLPSARVVHFEGAATGVNTARRRRGRWWYDSRRRYFLKHHGAAGLALADAFWAIGRATYVGRSVLGLGAGVSMDPALLSTDLLWGDLRALAGGEFGRVLREARRERAAERTGRTGHSVEAGA